MNKHVQQAQKILKNIKYVTIATASEHGKPWNTPVEALFDNNLNIYWFSDKESQHSQNIRQNQDIFIVMYDSTVAAGEGEGLYIEATAVELNDLEEVRAVRRLKKGSDDNSAHEFMGEHVRRVYKAVPRNIWVNDSIEKDGKFWRDFRVEIPLDELKN